MAKKSPVPNVKNQRRGIQSNNNSAVKTKQIVKKHTNVENSADGEDFKNKTLRFTNVGNFGT